MDKDVKKNTQIDTNPIKVSVVVPCCNVEKYLEECLDSIVNQTLKDIEIICINDGSKDNTLKIIEAYAKKDSRIKIIDKPNSGYGDSMNKGFQMATGTYIGIVESDDYIEPEMFEILYNAAWKNEADIVKSNFWFYWSSPKRDELHEYFKKDECNKVIVPSKYDNGSLYGRKPSIWSAIYKRDFIRKNNIDFLPTPGASFQDTSFTFKVYSKAERMLCIYEPFLHYRQDNENSSVNNVDKKMHCVCDEYEEIERYIGKYSKKNKNEYEIYAAAFYDSCIWTYENLGIKKKYEFLQTISPWFERLINLIGLENIRFGDSWWKFQDMQRIAETPFEYHLWRHEERYEQIGHSFNYKETLTKINNFEEIAKKQKEKTKTPFFSIIVPVYNNEKFLPVCLDSLLFQNFEDFEVICINDGSKDHSLSILEEYAAIDDRFIIVNQENNGPSATRNVGINLAIGEYILFLDSDDYYSQDACQRIYKEIIKRKKPDSVVFGTNIFPDVPKASDWHYYILTTPDVYYEKINEKLLLTKPYLKIYSWRCCFKNQFIAENNILFNTDFKYGEDAMLVFEAMIKAQGVSVISDKLYNYRHFNANSLMNQISKNNEEFAKCQIRILEEMLVLASDNNMSASPELLEYVTDFVYSSIDNCPMPTKQKCILDFIKIIKQYNLDKQIDNVKDSCKGFWIYCCEEEKRYIHNNKLTAKFKNIVIYFVRKLLPPSRQAFYDYSIQNLEHILRLEQQIANLEVQNQRVEWLCNELIKKYNDDNLWMFPETINKLDEINKNLIKGNKNIQTDYYISKVRKNRR